MYKRNLLQSLVSGIGKGGVYALLALAVIVSLFGIVNTLVLSISERTRELGLLRAVGTTQRQVRRIVRYEAVITALIGGVLGIVLGAILAVLFTQPIDEGSTDWAIVPCSSSVKYVPSALSKPCALRMLDTTVEAGSLFSSH